MVLTTGITAVQEEEESPNENLAISYPSPFSAG